MADVAEDVHGKRGGLLLEEGMAGASLFILLEGSAAATQCGADGIPVRLYPDSNPNPNPNPNPNSNPNPSSTYC